MTAAFPPPSLAAQADRPILFSTPMVRALLADRKTQTRRILKPQPDMAKIGQPCHPEPRGNGRWVWMARDDRPDYQCATADFRVRFEKGDRLWVRESYSKHVRIAEPYHLPPDYHDAAMGAWYWADGNPDHGDWEKPRPSIHMPRWASRLTLTVTDVRVQRLQDITDEDAKAEGVALAIAGQGDDGTIKIRTHRTGFVGVWNEINGNWLDNPWVCAVSFEVHRCNIDEMSK